MPLTFQRQEKFIIFTYNSIRFKYRTNAIKFLTRPNTILETSQKKKKKKNLLQTCVNNNESDNWLTIPEGTVTNPWPNIYLKQTKANIEWKRQRDTESRVTRLVQKQIISLKPREFRVKLNKVNGLEGVQPSFLLLLLLYLSNFN